MLACAGVLQGLEDEVVPPNQAEMIVDALRSRGVPVAYVAFEGEQHGFRQAAKMVALSPTAFSDRIRRLEEGLGKELFSRTTRKVALSGAGEALFRAPRFDGSDSLSTPSLTSRPSTHTRSMFASMPSTWPK